MPSFHQQFLFCCRKRLKEVNVWSSNEQKICPRCAKKSTTLFTTIFSKMVAVTQHNSFMYTENCIAFYTQKSALFIWNYQYSTEVIRFNKKTLLYITAAKLSKHDCDEFLETLEGVPLAAWTQPTVPLPASFDSQLAHILLSRCYNQKCNTPTCHCLTHIQPQLRHGPMLLLA